MNSKSDLLSVCVIITSSHEPKTIGKALQSILKQDSNQIKQIIVVAPDEETLTQAKKAKAKSSKVVLLKDQGRGKPAALNLAFQKAQAEIIVLTDGDVYLDENALTYLLGPFKDPRVGGISGRPVSLNSKDNLFGFWSHFLTDVGHQIRLVSSQEKQFIELSGYLLAVRQSLVAPLPETILADDSYLSHLINKSNSQTAYAPEAKVFVKYPDNLGDWFKQKERSAYEYWQKNYSSGQTMRSPLKEVSWGIKFAFGYPQNLKEAGWLILLFLCRLTLWLKIFFLKLIGQKNLWVRVKSTK